jgi:hypothetical protein
MSSSLRNSTIRLAAGCALLALSVGVMLFVLPNAAQQKRQQVNASAKAKKYLEDQDTALLDLKAREKTYTESNKRKEELLGNMPNQNAGVLQWELSRKLYELAQKNNVRLQAMKYGVPTREGSKGTDLEVLDVEFTATGVYQGLKPFMLGLEDTRESKLPFAVVNAKLEESSDGARLSVTLRAFRRTEGALADDKKEGS